MSQDQLNTNLLGQGKKGSQSYQKCIQQIQTQIQILKNKNNMLQKQSDNDIDDNDIKKEIHQQTQFVQVTLAIYYIFQLEINKIKKMLQDFSQKFKDPTAKNKLKQMWKNASKQIQRNKIITERIINEAPRQSFLNREQKMKRSLLGDNRKSKNYKNNNNARRPSRDSSDIVRQVTYNPNGPSQLSQQQYDQNQLQIQNQIQKQKNQLLNHLQKKNQQINKVMNQIANMVDEQGEEINVITGNMNQAHQNVVSANQQLSQASANQKKARKKYVCLLVVIFLIVIIGGGLYFLITSNTKKE